MLFMMLRASSLYYNAYIVGNLILYFFSFLLSIFFEICSACITIVVFSCLPFIIALQTYELRRKYR